MATANDVAAFILKTGGSMTAMKMQKLVYYSQAWHLVWEEKPLFDDRIEAWANGPVVRSLYSSHRGHFLLDQWAPGNPDALDDREMTTIRSVLSFYGPMTAHQLSELTHREDPWLAARAGLTPGERSSAEITQASMHEYYDSLTSASQ